MEEGFRFFENDRFKISNKIISVKSFFDIAIERKGNEMIF